MSDFPPARGLTGLDGGVISATSSIIQLGPSSSTAWPAANLAIFVPVRVPVPVTVYKMVVAAGSTASGNFDVGIYDIGGNKLVSSGSTAKSSSNEQVLDVTDTYLGEGIYYMALSASNTGNYQLVVPAGTTPVPLQKMRLWGILQMATAFTLPATATFAAATTVTGVPHIAALTRPY